MSCVVFQFCIEFCLNGTVYTYIRVKDFHDDRDGGRNTNDIIALSCNGYGLFVYGLCSF